MRYRWPLFLKWFLARGATPGRPPRTLPPARAAFRPPPSLLPLEDRWLPTAVPIGLEFPINTFTPGDQSLFAETRQAAAMNAQGDFLVTWSSKGQDGDGWGVYAQRFDPRGARVGGEFRVNTTTADDQWTPAAALDDLGGSVIVWASRGQDGSGWGIYAQRYDLKGDPLGGEFRVNTATANDQTQPAVATDAAGNFVVTWTGQNQDGSGRGVYARLFSALGVPLGAEFRVNNTTSADQENPSVAMDAVGNFVVAWSSQGADGSGRGVYARLFSALGVPLGGEYRANTTTAGDQRDPSVSIGPAGDFVITWSSQNQDGSGWGVYARRFGALGNPQGGEFLVNTTTAGDQRYSSVTVSPSGDFLIAWSSQNQDGSGWGVYARWYDSLARPRRDEWLVNTTTAGDQAFPSVAADSWGEVVIVWTGNGLGDDVGVFGQWDTAAGIRVTPTAGLLTTEGGGQAAFSISLTNQPLKDVTIPIASGDPSEGTVDQTSLTFTRFNWDTPQVVTVTGVDDRTADGPFPYAILVGPAVSDDPLYDRIDPADVSVTNADDDTAGIVVSPLAGLTTSEAGGTAAFTVVLTSRPTADVVIPLTSGDPSEGAPDRASLTFTPLDWDTPQLVTVTGLPDDLADGDVPYSLLVGPAASADPVYDGLDAPDVSLVNLDVPAGPASGPTPGTQPPPESPPPPAGEPQPTTPPTEGPPPTDGPPPTSGSEGPGQVPGASPPDPGANPPRGGPGVPPGDGPSAPPGTPEGAPLPPPAGDQPPTPGERGPAVLFFTDARLVPPAGPPPDPVAPRGPEARNLPPPGPQPVTLPPAAALDAATGVGGGAAAPEDAGADPGAAPPPAGEPVSPPIPPPVPPPVPPPPPPPPVPPAVVPPAPVAEAAVRPAEPLAPVTVPDLLFQQLDALGRETAEGGMSTFHAAGAVTVVASVGIVLLSARNLSWLLSLMAARPLWKQCDPLEVLFAWEEEKARRRKDLSGDGEEETLQSLVARAG